MKRPELINQAVDTFFDFLSSVIGNFSANIVPLLAGILPAYMTWKHIVFVLNFPSWVGLAGAGVIEFIGLGAGNELMKVWNHNRRYKDDKNKMPMLAPFATAFWYIAIMVAFNVILEAFPTSVFWKIVSIALFATLAVPAYALVAGKTLRMEWKNERANAKAERTANERRTNERKPKKHERSERTNSGELRTVIYQLLDEYYQTNGQVAGVSDLARTISKSANGTEDGYERYKGYISEVRKDWMETRQ